VQVIDFIMFYLDMCLATAKSGLREGQTIMGVGDTPQGIEFYIDDYGVAGVSGRKFTVCP
jgi:hypothetical protein